MYKTIVTNNYYSILSKVKNFTEEQLINYVTKNAQKKSKKIVLNINAHDIYLSLKNPIYKKILLNSDLLYADGWGTVYLAKYFSMKLKNRVNVGDYINSLLEQSMNLGLTIYLFGCEYEVVYKTVLNLCNKYPKLVISGYHSGFYSKNEEKKIISEMNSCKPDIVLVGMGIPMQEEFIWKNYSTLPNAIYLGVGGVFHYLAETKKRAPLWVREFRCEWLYRLIQEPRRLFARYTYELLYLAIMTIRLSVLQREKYD